MQNVTDQKKARLWPKAREMSDKQSLLDRDEVQDNVNPCGCSSANGCRKLIMRFVMWPGFDAFILLVIVANCAMMASESPLDPPGTPKALFIEKLGFWFKEC